MTREEAYRTVQRVARRRTIRPEDREALRGVAEFLGAPIRLPRAPCARAHWQCSTCGFVFVGGGEGVFADFGMVWCRACLPDLRPDMDERRGLMLRLEGVAA